MGYRVHRDTIDFKVVEVVEGEVRTIISNIEESKAKKISSYLNRGNGFDGWTPDFFLNKFVVSV